ncbi:MAG: helix-turn-helix domain-containing protein [Fimbriimonadaceae bacterium]
MKTHPEPLMTPSEVMSYLRISRTKFYDMVRQGLIPHVRIGRLIRIKQSDLQAFAVPAREPEKLWQRRNRNWG